MEFKLSVSERLRGEPLRADTDPPLPDNPVDEGKTRVVPDQVESPLALSVAYRVVPATATPHIQTGEGTMKAFRVIEVRVDVDLGRAAHLPVQLVDHRLHVLSPPVPRRVAVLVTGRARNRGAWIEARGTRDALLLPGVHALAMATTLPRTRELASCMPSTGNVVLDLDGRCPSSGRGHLDTSFPRWLMCCLMKTGSDKFPMNSVNGRESFLTFF
jgi:hypothetical protein